MPTQRQRALPYGLLLALALVLATWLLTSASGRAVGPAQDTSSTFDASALVHHDVGTVGRVLRGVTPHTTALTTARALPTHEGLAPGFGSVAITRHGPPLYALLRVYRL